MRVSRKLLSDLLPGLLPLLIYQITSAYGQSGTALLLAILTAGAEVFLFISLSGRISKLVFVDLCLVIFLGTISLLLTREIFLKLKPALLDLFLLVIFSGRFFTNNKLVQALNKKYLKSPQLFDSGRVKPDRKTKVLIVLLLIHFILSIYSGIYLPGRTWFFLACISFYLIFVFYHISDSFQMKTGLIKSLFLEMVPLVDEDGNVTGKAPRQDCHFNPLTKLLHPVVHLHVLNNKGELFLQQRALTKDIQPGKWDTAVGGHISYGEDIETALRRETREEIGILDFQPVFIRKYIWETDVEKELVFMFLCILNSGISLNSKELDAGRFWSFTEITENLYKEVFTPNFEEEFGYLRSRY